MGNTDSQQPERPRYGASLEFADKCPDYGTPEHIKLGGGRGPVYEPPRWMDVAIKRRNDAGVPDAK